MSATVLKPNWLYLGFIIAVAGAGLGFIGGSLTMQAYKEWRAGVALSGGWSWPIIAGVDLACLAVFAGLLLKVRWDTTVIFDDTALARNSILGVRRIRWSEVRRIKHVGFGLRVQGERTTIVLSPHAYHDPDAVVREVLEHTRSNRTQFLASE
jgi:hypothetical protein